MEEEEEEEDEEDEEEEEDEDEDRCWCWCWCYGWCRGSVAMARSWRSGGTARAAQKYRACHLKFPARCLGAVQLTA